MFSNPIRANHYNLPALAPASSPAATAASDLHNYKLASSLHQSKSNPKYDHLDPLQNEQCRVCDEPAAGFHFGAFTCEGCKSFFGRTCNNQSVIAECKNNYRCVVDKKNRTSCKACRLRKCLMVGMSKSGSRYGRRSNWFKIHCLMKQKGSKIKSSGRIHPEPEMPRLPYPSIKCISRSSSPTLLKIPPSSSSTFPITPLSASSLPSPYAVYSQPPLLSSSYPFPFYRLSPLLAAASSNPFLANSILFSLAAAGHRTDFLDEQSSLRSSLAASLESKHEDMSNNNTSPSSPMDLTVKNNQEKKTLIDH